MDDVGATEGAEQVYEQDSGYYAQEAGIQAENNEIFFSGNCFVLTISSY